MCSAGFEARHLTRPPRRTSFPGLPPYVHPLTTHQYRSPYNEIVNITIRYRNQPGAAKSISALLQGYLLITQIVYAGWI